MITARDQFHINAPGLMTARDRARDTVITAIMWGFYLYLWVPLISLCAWLLGFEFAYDVMVRAGGARELARVLELYALIVGVIFCVVTVWSVSNRIRYGHLHRRQAAPPVQPEEMASHFGLDTKFVEHLRANKTSTVRFGADGRPALQAHERIAPGRYLGPRSRCQ